MFCERQVRAIYADVWIEINGQQYEPSVNSGVRLDRDVLNVDSFGAPCDTGSGSSYYGVAYVAISDYDGSINEDEYESFNGLIC